MLTLVTAKGSRSVVALPFRAGLGDVYLLRVPGTRATRTVTITWILLSIEDTEGLFLPLPWTYKLRIEGIITLEELFGGGVMLPPAETCEILRTDSELLEYVLDVTAMLAVARGDGVASRIDRQFQRLEKLAALASNNPSKQESRLAKDRFLSLTTKLLEETKCKN